MRFNWNKETIDWYYRASLYTGFHEKLAGLVLPLLPESPNICDVGCGPGLIDLALAKHVPAITCVEKNAAVLDFLRTEISMRQLTNIEVKQQDVAELEGHWDVIILSWFGGADYLRLQSFARHLIIVTDDVHTSHLLKHGAQTRPGIECVEEQLTKAKLPYSIQRTVIEYGQPYLSLEEALCQALQYTPEKSEAEARDYLSARLEKRSGEYPYYLPHPKKIAIVVT